ncbi:MAG: PAS domain S-box protein [Ignavibacteria bacterium]|jgi:PAS domain S-box-containing protein|nr:PAS domain S-box protein [Ignavibacteria bacterium]MCU7501810.1 PAS domain S-box protein [Ignavibacteria bacterium]MCU7514844.1 PAS domain S-box protein [Ignavibacteria bacterium]
MAKESIKLLVVEDNPGDAALIEEMIGDISEIRVEMLHVTRLTAGLEALEKYSMDAVLLDLGLPDSFGIDTLHRIQTHTSGVPVVVMTGLNDKQVAVKAIKAGAQDYLVKGRIDSELLEHSLRYAIERKRIEEALIESQSELKATFDQAAVGIAHVSLDGRWLKVNQKMCDITGYTPDELSALDFQRLTHPDDLPKDLEQVQMLLKGSISTYSMEKRYIRKDGTNIWVNLTVSLVRDTAGNPAYFISVIEDISERKKIEAEVLRYSEELRKSKEALEKNALELDALNKNLQEANASKDKFFSIVAHDLRSPFSALLGFTEYLSGNIDELEKDEIKDFSFRVHTSLKRIFRLVDNLLQWSTLQSGRMKFTPVSFCLNHLIREVLDIYQVNAARKRVNLNFEFDGDYDVFADKNMADTVIRNLLSNALKFTYPDGRVTISVHDDAEENIIVAVSDTGTGISQEDISKLFRIEENVSKVGTDKEKGTGLGLILVKDFVERNGGKIWVESEPGQGSTFKFTLKRKAL